MVAGRFEAMNFLRELQKNLSMDIDILELTHSIWTYITFLSVYSNCSVVSMGDDSPTIDTSDLPTIDTSDSPTTDTSESPTESVSSLCKRVYISIPSLSCTFYSYR